MTAKTKTDFTPRSTRIPNRPDRFTGLVRYSGRKLDHKEKAAQFADISSSGMRLISRHPTSLDVGDFLTVDFTLPGSNRHITRPALVARKSSEYVFSVRFLNKKDDLPEAIIDLSEHLRWNSVRGAMSHLSYWYRAHSTGFWISIAGLALGGALATWIFLGSDQHLGKELRSWGKPQPQQWSWDYINGFNRTK